MAAVAVLCTWLGAAGEDPIGSRAFAAQKAAVEAGVSGTAPVAGVTVWTLPELAVRSAWLHWPPRLPEYVEMLRDVLLDRNMGPGIGWFHPGESRYSWSSLAARFDRNGDNRIGRDEFDAEPAWFTRLDRNRDGAIRPADLTWDASSADAQRARSAARWFAPLDANSNGRLSPEEWETAFDRLAGDRAHLTEADLVRVLQGGRQMELAIQGRQANRLVRPPRHVMLKWLLRGQIGEVWEGPRVDRQAPDFDLPLHKSPAGGGPDRIRLSQFRGKKPVVLLFGSFT